MSEQLVTVTLPRAQIQALGALFDWDPVAKVATPRPDHLLALAETIAAMLDRMHVAAAAQYPTTPSPIPTPAPGGIVRVAQIEDVAWGDGRRVLLGAWGCEAVAARFVVPDFPPVWEQAGRCGLAEYTGGGGGGTASRQMSLSTIAGDFRPEDPTGVNGPFVLSPGTTATIDFGVGYPGLPNLRPGGTYYMSMRNWDPELNNRAGGCSVPDGESRPASYSFVWPSR